MSIRASIGKRNVSLAAKVFTYRLVQRFSVYLHSLNYDMADTIVVSGSSRGGTTWLQEIVTANPGIRVVWEPLNFVEHGDSLRARGFYLRTYKSGSQKWPEGYRFLSNLLKGRNSYRYGVYEKRKGLVGLAQLMLANLRVRRYYIKATKASYYKLKEE